MADLGLSGGILFLCVVVIFLFRKLRKTNHEQKLILRMIMKMQQDFMERRAILVRAIDDLYVWRTKSVPNINERSGVVDYDLYTFANIGLMRVEKILRALIRESKS